MATDYATYEDLMADFGLGRNRGGRKIGVVAILHGLDRRGFAVQRLKHNRCWIRPEGWEHVRKQLAKYIKARGGRLMDVGQ